MHAPQGPQHRWVEAVDHDRTKEAHEANEEAHEAGGLKPLPTTARRRSKAL